MPGFAFSRSERTWTSCSNLGLRRSKCTAVYRDFGSHSHDLLAMKRNILDRRSCRDLIEGMLGSTAPQRRMGRLSISESRHQSDSAFSASRKSVEKLGLAHWIRHGANFTSNCLAGLARLMVIRGTSRNPIYSR